MSIQYHIDFEGDLKDWYLSELSSWGYDVSTGLSVEDIGRLFVNACNKRIIPTPRKVEVSDVLDIPTDFQKGFENIKRTAIAGGDLNKFLSRLINDVSHNDAMLNHWGIHHFHLGTQIETDGFVQRTGPLLFARVTNEVVYFINVMQHGDWSQQYSIHILHRNWPESLEDYRLYNVRGEKNLSDLQISTLWGKSCNFHLEMDDGTVYSSPGGGVMASGISAKAVIETDFLIFQARDWQRQIVTDLDSIVQQIRTAGHGLGDDIDFKWDVSNKTVFAIDKNTRIGYELNFVLNKEENKKG
jgi:hypothetical protein